jgi:ketosteroid isomerase-like protein
MSEENIETMRRALEAWNRGDLDAWAEFVADDVVWHPLAEMTQTEPVRGKQATLAFVRDWIEPWQAYRIEVKRLIDAGDRVVMITTQTGTDESGTEVPIDMHGVALMRDGKLVEMKWFQDERAALEAASVSE